jgi:iron complex transport system ATP-binding protein
VSLLQLDHVTVGYRPGTPVLQQVSLSVAAGAFAALIGPNGSGKSTFLRVAAGVMAPWSGTVTLAGQDLNECSRRDLARRVAVVPQAAVSDFEFSVEETVAMGRHPHLKRFQGMGDEDRLAITQALELTSTTDLASRSIRELSGGEHQRVIIARALAQQPQLLLLDEPTNHLDINHQVEILDLLSELHEETGLTIVCVTHDLNAAAEFGEQLVLMDAGRPLAIGSAAQVLTEELVRQAYGVDVWIEQIGGRARIIPKSRRHMVESTVTHRRPV